MREIDAQFEREFQFWRLSTPRKLMHAPGRVLRTRLTALLASRLDRPIKLEAPTFWGERIKIVLPEGVSHALYYNRFIEAGLTRFMLERLRPGMVFVDVGAHFGYFSLLAGRLTGDAGSVHAFEPTPSTFEWLRANTASKANIKINRLALWSSSTTLDFYDYGLKYSGLNSFTDPRLPTGSGSARKLPGSRIRVEARRLDDYLEANKVRPDMVKIDVESSEAEALKGMEGTLARHRPLLAVEMGDFEIPGVPASRSVIDSLAKRGYSVVEFQDAEFVRHRPADRYPSCNLFFLPER